MGDSSTCPACQSVLSSNDTWLAGTGRCPRCGTILEVPSAEDNPFAPPETKLGPPPGLVEDVHDLVPTSVFGKFLESFRLLGANFLLFGPLILTVWLPGNILINLIIFNHPERESATFPLSLMIEGLFGPIYVRGLLYALTERRRGRKVEYFEAITVGLRGWGRLFGTRFFTGLFIFLGLIALIVPGIILLIQYALIDPIVVLEGKSGPEARLRSKELTKGKKWQIFWAVILFLNTVIPLMIGLHVIVGEMERIANVATAVALDCTTDVLLSVEIIVMFLFYWEGVLREEAGMASEEIGGESSSS